MKVEALMTRNVRACSPNDTLSDAARIMWETDVGCLPVVDETHRVVAMVTDRDICMAAYTNGAPLRDLSVSTAMSKGILCTTPDTSIGDVERLMRDSQIRRVPVVDTVGHLVGLITLGDIARHAQSSPLRLPIEGLGVANTLASITWPRHVPGHN